MRETLYNLATTQLLLEAHELRLTRSVYKTIWPAEEHVLEKRQAIQERQESLGRHNRATAAVRDAWIASKLEHTEEGRDRKERQLDDCLELSHILEEEKTLRRSGWPIAGLTPRLGYLLLLLHDLSFLFYIAALSQKAATVQVRPTPSIRFSSSGKRHSKA